MKIDIQFRLRVCSGDLVIIGPGKVALLEAIHQVGSISAAARVLGMSYRRAWLLVAEMNRGLIDPVVSTSAGGASGGGAKLTESALEIIQRYRRIETLAFESTTKDIDALIKLTLK